MMADKTCPYCTLDTGGNHAPGCPSYTPGARVPPIPFSSTFYIYGETPRVAELEAENARLRGALERIEKLIGSSDYIRLPEAIAEARRALRGE